MDFAKPLNDRPVPFWPQAAPRRGHLLDGHLAVPHADSVFPDGHLEGVHLLEEHGIPSAPLLFDTPPYVFGRFWHAVKSRDVAGNVSAGASAASAQTINSSPARPFDFAVSGFDDGTGQVEFVFKKPI